MACTLSTPFKCMAPWALTLLVLPTIVSPLGQMASSLRWQIWHHPRLEICTYYIMALNSGPPRFLFCGIDPRAPKCMTYINAASKLLINVLYKYIPTKLLLRRDSTCNLVESSNPETLSQLACKCQSLIYLPSSYSVDLKLNCEKQLK